MKIGALILGLVLVGTSAFAAPKKNDGKAEFEKAMRYYQAQEFEAALPWFEKAYELSGRRASTIRALAQCERSLKRYEPAILHFEEYLATKPRPSDATAVEETVAILKELVADQRARAVAEAPPPPPPAAIDPPPPPPAPPPAPPPGPTPNPAITAETTPPSSGSIAPWFLVGGGAALTITGGVLFALGISAAGSVEDAPAGTPFNDLRSDADRAPLFTTLGGIGVGVGVAAIAGGVVWLLSEDGE
ncbi:MAG: tetratricopeptide repeat protein [Deltaproteobacteria bacterium]|nr:tetratricopeptide repeat protein [Deltaproteobacteria bacterium]